MRYLKNKEDEEPIESTSGVPAKDPSNVKSMIEEFPITQKCKSQEIAHTLRKRRSSTYIVV